MVKSSQTASTNQFAEGLSVTRSNTENGLTLTIDFHNPRDCVLHWGVSRRPGGAWNIPPESCWPQGTTPADAIAVRTPFCGGDQKKVTIHLDAAQRWRGLSFVVYIPHENRWIKNNGGDFVIALPRGGRSPEEALSAWMPQEDAERQTLALDSDDRLATAVFATPQEVCVRLVCDAAAPLRLHWGLAWQFRQEWQAPPEDYWPQGTTCADDKAVSTPFTERENLQYLELRFAKPNEGAGPRGLRFVLHQPGESWLKSEGRDLFLPLFESERDDRLGSATLADLAEEIVGVEMGPGSWTLMHRFNLCHDLLGKAQDDEDALALLFAWLRYSAIRQLDWQRNYNTKPRELSHAQDRLTARLAGVWRSHISPLTPNPSPPLRGRGEKDNSPLPRFGGEGLGVRGGFWARQMLTTLGRGGDGQRVRDEILHIMHRNNLKEKAGSFIEEWHQKLHNNTTPDDVVICQAFLAFLRGNGDTAVFYRTLEENGVTRQRLQSFERPIRTDPVLHGSKDALIGEFEHFLSILKSVHSGTDLDSAAGSARSRLDGGMNAQLDGLFALRNRKASAVEMAKAVVSLRTDLVKIMAANKDDNALRDLLFLDLALEECLRSEIERQNLRDCTRDELAELVRAALRNLALTCASEELSICAAHWEKLLTQPRDGREWALHARSVTDRAARWLQNFSNDVHQQLQPKAEVLGAAFDAEEWTIPLFSEEVIRGGPAFSLSLLLRPLDRLLREAAGMGGWQIISPGRAAGKVRAVARLLDVQNEHFREPAVLIADEVSGQEEIPEGVTAVLTSDAPDLVSHVAVRARNAGVLFATCFDDEEYQNLKTLAGHTLSLRVTPRGDVEHREPVGWVEERDPPRPVGGSRSSTHPTGSFQHWVIAQEQFAPGLVGGKANNLNGLRGRLPEWIQLPKSLALPFGVFDKVMSDPRNRALGDECQTLIASAEESPSETLAHLREKVTQLAAPDELRTALLENWQRLALPSVPWEQAWHTVCRVWASKWNERAYLSRRARRIPHDSLQMAVLIQEVVPAEYAFVIHTANPFNGKSDELFAEVVLGMGETLVGNYPGRALGFLCNKSDLEIRLVSYPSKSVGLFGRGVIFRSDSNGEDLPGFAGAGLYDSFLADEPEQRRLDYREEKLIWDAKFRDELLRSIARAGLEVERLLGSAQDVEGALVGGQLHIVQTRPQVGLNDDSLAA